MKQPKKSESPRADQSKQGLPNETTTETIGEVSMSKSTVTPPKDPYRTGRSLPDRNVTLTWDQWLYVCGLVAVDLGEEKRAFSPDDDLVAFLAGTMDALNRARACEEARA